ncbi:cytochrome P450 [Nocardia sp. NPDC052566]|uniref:cytochrome P450 n=1 Tax=Nocardia sp. NPDC052566 TaxID=3364330 RepID=UPI0037CC2261
MTVEVFDERFAAEPWAVLARLRGDGGVHRVRTPDGTPAWLVTRFGDVRAGLLDERLSTRSVYAGGTDYNGFALPSPFDMFLDGKPDDHAWMRRAITTEFSPRRLAEWSRTAPRIIEPLLGDLGERVDLVEEFAIPLPTAVLTELLGLAEPEREALLGWANSTLRASATPPRARDTLATMFGINQATIERARSAPDSVVGRLVTGIDANTTDHAAAAIFYLLFVWYEVLVDLIAGSVLALTVRREQLEAFRDMPDKQAGVDELLRYLSPQVLASTRFARTDLQIGENTIHAGDTVLLCLAAANHDPEIFDRPDELDLHRTRNPHLGLGHGEHACLGNVLVRTITAAVLDELFTRWPDLDLTVDPATIAWRSGFRHRGPQFLPVTLG